MLYCKISTRSIYDLKRKSNPERTWLPEKRQIFDSIVLALSVKPVGYKWILSKSVVRKMKSWVHNFSQNALNWLPGYILSHNGYYNVLLHSQLSIFRRIGNTAHKWGYNIYLQISWFRDVYENIWWHSTT